MNNLMIFENNPVEVFEFKGQVLFNPKHVAECLDIVDVNSSIRNFNQNQVIKLKNSDMHNMQIRKLNNAGENFLTESGVYKLIFKSHKEEAEKFQDWVTDEVLPSIRKTGSYNSKGITKEEILNIIKELPNDNLKNEVARMLIANFLPVGQKQVISNGLDIKALLNEFLQDETVILRQTEYGLAVDKYKLYDFFKPHGLKSTEVLRQLDNANLIFHRDDCRTIQVRYDGGPVRVVIIKE